MNLRVVHRFVLAILVVSLPASAADYPASGGVGTVEMPRATALGGGGSALGNDLTVSLLNPGILASCRQSSLSLGATRGVMGDLFGVMHASHTLGPGTVSAGLAYLHAGNSELGLPDGTVRMVSLQRDLALTLGWGMKLFGNVGGGLAVRYFRSQLLEEVSATAIGVDAGLQMPLTERFSGGIAVQNAGGPVKYGADTLSQPMTVRLGVAYIREVRQDIMGNPADYLGITQDLSYSPVNLVVTSSTGLEYNWNQVVGFRAGARVSTRRELAGFTAGLGLRTKLYRLDYAVVVGGPVDTPQTLSLTFLVPSGGMGTRPAEVDEVMVE